ncbi:MAG: CAP domain-containing protein [Patescibacteria group bacterium]
MRKIRIFFIVTALAALAAGIVFRDGIQDIYSRLAQVKETADLLIAEIQKEVLAPPPLRAPKESRSAFLTHAGTVAETNARRRENGLSPLAENAKLNAAAAAKVQDMFEKQYFEHVSPTGKDAGDLATEAGYQYILVGENLALGNFENDRALVDAWMASPGHRENILNNRYQEIGVAVAKGMFEGKSTWLAVQEFGLPTSACLQPDAALRDRIDANNDQLDRWREELDARRAELDAMRPKRGEEYNWKLEEYNSLVAAYNALLEETKGFIAEYNAQVKASNACAAG